MSTNTLKKDPLIGRKGNFLSYQAVEVKEATPGKCDPKPGN